MLESNKYVAQASMEKLNIMINMLLNGLFSVEGPFCGNGIVETNEECDCGFHGDCKDPCCVARDDPNTNSNLYCKRAPTAQCR